MEKRNEGYREMVLGRWYGRTGNRFLFLLACLVLIIFVYPFTEALDAGGLLLRIFTTAILILCVYALLDTTRYFIIAILLLIPAAGISWASYLAGETAPLSALAALTSLAFFLFVTLVILHRILTTRIVTIDTIYGAVCVYLLLAYLWGILYLLAALTVPGSFAAFYPETAALETLSHSDAMYLSFVTIATLGYGDIIPVANVSRSLAMLEAATGVLFIATFVARLVALAGVGTPHPPAEPAGKGDAPGDTARDGGELKGETREDRDESGRTEGGAGKGENGGAGRG